MSSTLRLTRHLTPALALVVLVTGPAAGGTECDAPEIEGYDRVACEIRCTYGLPLCEPIDERVQRKIVRRLEQTEALVVRAGSSTKAARTRRLTRKAGKRLDNALRQVRRAARRTRIEPDCETALSARLAELRSLVGDVEGEIPSAPAGLPDFVAGYERWLRMNAEPIPVRQGGDAHSGVKDVFVNRTRDELAPGGVQDFPYSNGTIVVKESTRPGDDFVHLVAIMRKLAGSDPVHGDWQFVEYTRDSAAAAFRLAFRDGVCWGCHGTVRGSSDWVYTLLDPAGP